MLLDRVVDLLQRRKIRFAIVGGYAVALHGAVRGTVDLDIVLRLRKADFMGFEAALKELGLAPRLPVSAEQVFDFREEYIQNRNLIAWSFSNPSNPTDLVDVIITHDLDKMRVEDIRSGGRTFPVLALSDLIAMKKKSGRPQDLEDIKALQQLKK